MGKVKRVNFIGGHHAKTYPMLYLSVSTVKRAIQDLECAGLIRKIK